MWSDGGAIGIQGQQDAGLPSEQDQEKLLGAQLRWWDDILGEVRQKLDARDTQMMQEYHRREDIDSKDIRFMLKEGDMLLMKQKLVGKLRPKSTGPYKFITYLGQHRVVAKVLDKNGKAIECSVANLIPLRGEA